MKTEENIEVTTEHGDWEPLVSISITEYERLRGVAEDVREIVDDLDQCLTRQYFSQNASGIRVPYHGPFCSMLPSTSKDLVHLSESLHKALGDE